MTDGERVMGARAGMVGEEVRAGEAVERMGSSKMLRAANENLIACTAQRKEECVSLVL